jgi:hypothetical protein
VRVTVRRRYSYDDGTVSDEEITVEADWTSSDAMSDMCARAHELWSWAFGDDAGSETETTP